MTYALVELSTDAAAPVELFEFTVPGSTLAWRYTTDLQPFVYAGNTYAPEAISRSAIKRTIQDTSGDMLVEVGDENPFALRLLAGLTERPIEARVYQYHRGDGEVVPVFQGYAAGVAFEGPKATITCLPRLAVASRRQVPWLTYQAGCNWQWGSKGCGVDKNAFRLGPFALALGDAAAQTTITENFDNGAPGWTFGPGSVSLATVGGSVGLLSTIGGTNNSFGARKNYTTTDALLSAEFTFTLSNINVPRETEDAGIFYFYIGSRSTAGGIVAQSFLAFEPRPNVRSEPARRPRISGGFPYGGYGSSILAPQELLPGVAYRVRVETYYDQNSTPKFAVSIFNGASLVSYTQTQINQKDPVNGATPNAAEGPVQVRFEGFAVTGGNSNTAGVSGDVFYDNVSVVLESPAGSLIGGGVTIPGTHKDGDLSNGWVERVRDGDKRFIEQNRGNFLALQSPFTDAQPGDQYYVYPGCRRTEADCDARFNNLVHFLGWPRLPTLNPFDRSAFYLTDSRAAAPTLPATTAFTVGGVTYSLFLMGQKIRTSVQAATGAGGRSGSVSFLLNTSGFVAGVISVGASSTGNAYSNPLPPANGFLDQLEYFVSSAGVVAKTRIGLNIPTAFTGFDTWLPLNQAAAISVSVFADLSGSSAYFSDTIAYYLFKPTVRIRNKATGIVYVEGPLDIGLAIRYQTRNGSIFPPPAGW